MISRLFLRVSAVALCLAGAAYIADTLVDLVAAGRNPGIGGFVPVLGLIGFPGFWLTLRRDHEALAVLGFVLTVLGLSGLVVVTFLMNFLFPSLMMDEVGGVVTVIGPHLAAIGVTFLLSALVLAVVAWPTGGRVRQGAIIYALGAIPLSLPPLMPAFMQDAGAVAVGAGLLIWGVTMLRGGVAIAEPEIA